MQKTFGFEEDEDHKEFLLGESNAESVRPDTAPSSFPQRLSPADKRGDDGKLDRSKSPNKGSSGRHLSPTLPIHQLSKANLISSLIESKVP